MILFFGPPGSGKSVQGKLLVERNGWKWLSTGELFRQSADPEVIARLASGELISDEMTNEVLNTALTQISDDVHVVLDGYPRNTVQADWLDARLPNHGREIVAVIVFEVPHDELVKRLSGRGRAEDTLQIVTRRLQIYEEQTRPVLEFYEARGVKVVKIDGNGEVNDVHERIQRVAEAHNLTGPAQG
ncbi:nucleoside monophosphate kinase [Aeromicrobium sp.]|nr:nucleoside monophosphate kinase [Candidatus Saccharibacteria bacterium]